MTAGKAAYHIAYEMTPRAWVDALRLMRNWFYRVGIALGVILVTLGIGLVTQVFGPSDPWFAGHIFVIVGVLGLVGSLWLGPERWAAKWRGRGVMGKTVEYDLAEDGIRYRQPLASGYMPWSALTEIRWNERTVVGLRDRILAWYAPTSALGTPEMQAEIIAFMQRHIVDANLAIGRPPAGAKFKEIGKNNG